MEGKEIEEYTFALHVTESDHGKNVMKIPENLIRRHAKGNTSDVVVELPNGILYYLTMKTNEKTLNGVQHLLQYVDSKKGGTLIFSYYGNGRFKTYILNADGCEIEYPRTTAQKRGLVLLRDVINAVGWKFCVRLEEQILKLKEFEIPLEFLNRFRLVIPEKCTLHFRNQQLIEASYLPVAGKIKVFNFPRELENMMTILLLFHYCGNGNFEVKVIDLSTGEERMTLQQNSQDNAPASESLEPHIEMECKNEEHYHAVFAAVMKKSNVDGSGHGVYIPPLIKPANREWNTDENVIFSTDAWAWNVRINVLHGKARFSAGWNRFVKEFKAEPNDILIFQMVEEEYDIVFHVSFALNE